MLMFKFFKYHKCFQSKKSVREAEQVSWNQRQDEGWVMGSSAHPTQNTHIQLKLKMYDDGNFLTISMTFTSPTPGSR